MIFNITLPEFNDITDKKNAEKIMGYLATLHNQLQYMMLNIDEDNLSDSLSSTINTASENAAFSKSSIVSLGNSLTSVSQTANKINWLISDGTSSTNFSLTSYTASLIAKAINIQGYVTFSDLNELGSTVINGNNIMTGSISANKLSVTDLAAISATIGGWSINNSGISSAISGNGSFYLNSPVSLDNCWLKACDQYGNTTFYIAKDGSCYVNGSFIASGSITADKILCDSQNRLDLTNNYYGIKVGKEMCITDGNVNCRIFVNNAGILTFDSGTGDSAFSFALNKNGTTYSLSVLNSAGNIVGTITL